MTITALLILPAFLNPARRIGQLNYPRYFRSPARYLNGAVADPLGAAPLYFKSVGAAMRSPVEMLPLLIILLVTVGLAVRAATYMRGLKAADLDSTDQTRFIDTCARTLILVLLSLIGLLTLGVMYGTVLGSADAKP